MWWGTDNALGSKVINGLEIPAALERAESEPGYPLVPVFVDVTPGDAVASLSAGSITVAFRALSEPSGEHDITFDWRAVIDARARLLEEGSLPTLLDTLANAREAFQARERSPELSLDPDLPLPLAFLVGYEWRVTTRLRLRVGQRTCTSFSWIEHAGPLGEEPKPVRKRLDGNGPVVVAVSCKDPLERAALAYMKQVRGSALVLLHVPGLLDGAGLRALARAAAFILPLAAPLPSPLARPALCLCLRLGPMPMDVSYVQISVVYIRT